MEQRKIISLIQFKQDRKKSWRKKYAPALKRFTESFVHDHFRISFNILNDIYVHRKIQDNEMAWDYHDFRDDLRDAIREVYGQLIWDEARRQYWFDQRYLSKDELVELCISCFILGNSMVANQ